MTAEANSGPPKLIEAEQRSWASFAAALSRLLAADCTCVYVDTSFLMWLTKIGSESRQELFGWLVETLPNRIHVPVWAAHEYVKHHVRGTIAGDFASRCKAIQAFARSVYGELRPFIDEPVGQRVENPVTARANMRAALGQLDQVVGMAATWTREYERHAAEVIDFINTHVLWSSALYEELEIVGTYADSRLKGSVPPGFKDRWKDERGDSSHGDLLLWKEMLQHARSVNPNGIILITNDTKNDWTLGGARQGAIDPELRAFRASWKPVPTPHPMLVYEAYETAGVQHVEVVDSSYLGAYLEHIRSPNTRAFADVALVPDTPDTAPAPATSGSTSSGNDTSDLGSPAHSETAPAFSDPPGVYSTRGKLRAALLASREQLSATTQRLVDAWMNAEEGGGFRRIDSGTLSGVDQNHLVSAARALHDGSLSQEPGYVEALADIAAQLPELPPNTAAAIYFGFLASMYLEPNTNQTRFPPRSSVMQQLFDYQHQDLGSNAVDVIAHRLKHAPERPLYIPSTRPTPIQLVFDSESDSSPADQLTSVRLDTGETDVAAFPVELLDPVKTSEFLHLAALFTAGSIVDPTAIVAAAGELFAFPIDLAEPRPISGTFVIPGASSFRDPRDVRIPQE